MTVCSWSFSCLHMQSLASFKKSPLGSVLVALAGTKTLFLHPPRFPQMTMKTKQRMLTEDWELFKQRRFIEEQVCMGGRAWLERSFSPQSEGLQSPRCTIFLADLFADWFSFPFPRLCTPPGTSAFME